MNYNFIAHARTPELRWHICYSKFLKSDNSKAMLTDKTKIIVGGLSSKILAWYKYIKGYKLKIQWQSQNLRIAMSIHT